MKKTLVAMASVAALGAMSTAAMAQSSMTIYGNLDQSLVQVSQNGQSQTNSGSNYHSSSFWGITSTEDIGGGLKASFDLRSEITLMSGQAASTSTGLATGNSFAAPVTTAPTTSNSAIATASQKPEYFNRNAFVQLAGDSWGALKVGRQEISWWTAQGTVNTTPGSASFGFGNLTSMQGNASNLLSQTTGGSTVITNNPTSLQFQGQLTGNPSYMGEGNAFMGGFSYTTPTFSGFKAQYQVGVPKTTYTTAGNANNMWSLAAYYDAGAIHLTAATHVVNDSTGGNQLQQTLLGGTYKMGQWQLVAAVNKQKFGGMAVTTAAASAPADNNTAQAIGVNYDISSALNIAASYGTLTDDVNSANKFTQTGVVANYKFSPRTSIYAGLGNGKNTGGMMQSPIYGMGGGGAPTATGQTVNAFLTGIKHTF